MIKNSNWKSCIMVSQLLFYLKPVAKILTNTNEDSLILAYIYIKHYGCIDKKITNCYR